MRSAIIDSSTSVTTSQTSMLRTQKFLILLSLLIRLIAMGSVSLIAEEAYYWNYANHLDFGYLDHPPMVAGLIKLSTLLLGSSEFGVRAASLFCWCICTGFSYQLTRRIAPDGGVRAIFLLSILPFFFLHALIITPDLPLIAAWSACLYYLYLALIEAHKTAWYWFGVWLGLGMLAKYTIVLLGPAILVYLIATKQLRRILLSPQPYCAAIIAFLLFSPVIYWNATHHWTSFLFQSTRRFTATDEGSLLAFIGLLIFFLTPLGIIGLGQLFVKKAAEFSLPTINVAQRRFIQCFTLIPLLFFASFSATHTIKFNWIGPSLLALIPWLASIRSLRFNRYWLWLGFGLLMGYSVFIVGIVSGRPTLFYRAVLTKYIDWNNFNQQVHHIAEKAQQKWHKPLALLPIDRYNLASELAYYQMRAHRQDKNRAIYPVVGSDRFGYEALMYHFWSKDMLLNNDIILLITENAQTLDSAFVKDKVIALSPIQSFWSHNQGAAQPVIPYYYQLVRFKQS